MKRLIKTHETNGLNEAIEVRVLDEPGSGGACHRYQVCIPILNPAESHVEENSRRMRSYCEIHFQEGPIQESGLNGISNEALLAVVRDRLEGFQSGQYACHDNQMALDHVCGAMEYLRSRTEKRLERGVEGTSSV